MSIRIPLRQHLRDTRQELSNFYSSPAWWWNQTKKSVLFPIHRVATRTGQYTRVVEEDWDILLILDGCREDLFREVADIEQFDEYRAINSGASATKEWVVRQFYKGAFTDTIYLTGNAVVSEYIQAAFYQFEDVWRDAYDDERRLIPPEPLAERARIVRKEYPRKRLIVHFSQPHYPFINYPELQYHSKADGPSNVWHALRRGYVNEQTVWNAYADNLRTVLNVAEALAEDLGGRVVMTSDHGNLFGERIFPFPLREWGHPPGLAHPNLRTVPWAVLSGESTSTIDNRDITEQLEALGYL
ncbi:hypothetical protein ACFQO4_04750 [Saliphagus sp. GCM10025334]